MWSLSAWRRRRILARGFVELVADGGDVHVGRRSAGGGGDRPNRIKNGNLPVSERTIDRWFDLTAWASPAQFTYGNSGRGILVGPGSVNTDFGLQREFPFGEAKRVQFRWEMFNAFNRARGNGHRLLHRRTLGIAAAHRKVLGRNNPASLQYEQLG